MNLINLKDYDISVHPVYATSEMMEFLGVVSRETLSTIYNTAKDYPSQESQFTFDAVVGDETVPFNFSIENNQRGDPYILFSLPARAKAELPPITKIQF